MSRRTGQRGHIEPSGRWWVVRWWMDVPGQEKRRHMRERICPISGPGSLSKSGRERRAREIITASGADTVEYFNKVVEAKTTVSRSVNKRSGGSTMSEVGGVSPLQFQHWKFGMAVSITGLTRTSENCPCPKSTMRS